MPVTRHLQIAFRYRHEPSVNVMRTRWDIYNIYFRLHDSNPSSHVDEVKATSIDASFARAPQGVTNSENDARHIDASFVRAPQGMTNSENDAHLGNMGLPVLAKRESE